jgi:Flp pilus assembly protein TadD
MIIPQAIRIDPDNAYAYRMRFAFYVQAGHFDEAMDDLNSSLRLDPNNAELYIMRARMFANAGRANEVLRDFNMAYRLDPDNELVQKFREEIEEAME